MEINKTSKEKQDIIEECLGDLFASAFIEVNINIQSEKLKYMCTKLIKTTESLSKFVIGIILAPTYIKIILDDLFPLHTIDNFKNAAVWYPHIGVTDMTKGFFMVLEKDITFYVVKPIVFPKEGHS